MSSRRHACRQEDSGSEGGSAAGWYTIAANCWYTIAAKRWYIIAESYWYIVGRKMTRVLHLAASTSESEVELALTLLLESAQVPTSDAVRALVQHPRPAQVPELAPAVLDLRAYDALISGRGRHG